MMEQDWMTAIFVQGFLIGIAAGTFITSLLYFIIFRGMFKEQQQKIDIIQQELGQENQYQSYYSLGKNNRTMWDD